MDATWIALILYSFLDATRESMMGQKIRVEVEEARLLSGQAQRLIAGAACVLGAFLFATTQQQWKLLGMGCACLCRDQSIKLAGLAF